MNAAPCPSHVPPADCDGVSLRVSRHVPACPLARFSCPAAFMSRVPPLEGDTTDALGGLPCPTNRTTSRPPRGAPHGLRGPRWRPRRGVCTETDEEAASTGRTGRQAPRLPR